MLALYIDFETYSACDLKTEGLDNYASHRSTGVHCMAFAFGDEEVLLWKPPGCVANVLDHVNTGGLVYAHNAAFELAIWNKIMASRHNWPPLHPEQCRDTMAMAYAMALPGSLEGAANALGIPERKDVAGKRIMLQLAKPKPDGAFWKPADDPAKFQKLYEYCMQDVEVERALHQRLLELSPDEQKLWALDYLINQRGVTVDLPAINQAMLLVFDEQKRLNERIQKITDGAVTACSEVQRIVKWISGQGVEVLSLGKADVLEALSGDLPPQVQEVLELRQEAAKSSTSKLAAMKARANQDGRVRGIHQFHGASTGRWAGRGIQTQNLPRPRVGIEPQDVESMVSMFGQPEKLNVFYGPVMAAIADCVRGMIIAPKGQKLIACDFSAVEARVLAWLAGQESVLQIFRDHLEIYKYAAADIYHVKAEAVDKDQRQIGKVAVLALGFGGGVGAFQSMAKDYNLEVPDAQAEEIKVAWREANPKIVQFWYALENAAIQALRTGGTVEVGTITWRKKGSFLWCRLPSGRLLCYPYPELRTVTTPWGAEKEALTFLTCIDPSRKLKILPDDNAGGSWQRISTYGGSLAENVTQAMARDLMREAMSRLEDRGFPITMHVHDEIIVEVPESSDESTVRTVESVMSVVPDWAKGLPIEAKGWIGKRYRK